MSIAHEEAVLDAASVNALFHEARTANAFQGEVTEQQLQAIWELTKFGPSAFNAQPLRVTFVQSPEKRAELVDAMMAGNQPKTAAAPAVAVLSYDTEWHAKWDEFSPGWDAPKAMFSDNAELSGTFANNNAHLQAGYFILAVRALGLSAGPMTGADFSAIDAAFFPEGDQKSFLVVNIGQAGEGAWGAPKPKFGFDEAVTVL
ncbi:MULTISPECIES: malonic semialdehyde reductase [Arthrobacter]|uniref:3-hydroxypropanoate dehydrogenase n=1 Tax=Arthrobacter woluwensis TaxID=156980 RepID=A0A1H4JXA4_9MICC|nr:MULTISPECIES: malonic semialdehyde reductase [Arthrobacter]MBO9704250.1 malonic semialdehyde reductase [Arthrobacter sp.]MDQ0710446.1 3-hydroxypropanoate dehydrogenase [Arthrobacter woluwensis]PSS43378.1 malonic semialdehyde reductase [Arthrobacter woluwensis]WFR84134.1 malonic semialdehyde reductase [Arthrobacter sp. Y-9]SEB50262.1 3-hydroxypropanoate dehydrogenase [Arthrobacter woluwensis]